MINDAATETETDSAHLAGALGPRFQPVVRRDEVLEHLRAVDLPELHGAFFIIGKATHGRATVRRKRSEVGKTGGFSFDRVTPGTYFVECVDFKTGRVLGTSAPVTVVSAARVSARVFLDSDAPDRDTLGSFTGLVWGVDNRPIARARVELRDTGSAGVVMIGVTDRVGEFVFKDVPPGQYVVEYVSADVRQVLAASPPYLIHRNEERTVLVSLAPRGIVVGVALADTDGPIAGAEVQLRDAVSMVIVGTTTTGANGEFRFEAVWPGAYAAELLAVGTRKTIGVSAPFTVVARTSVATVLRASRH